MKRILAHLYSSAANLEMGKYFEGDMILSKKYRELSHDSAKNHMNNAAARWPGGVVPYVIEGSFSE